LRGVALENGYIESFNGKLRDEVINREAAQHLLKPGCLSRIGDRNIIGSGATVRSNTVHPLPRLPWQRLQLNNWYNYRGQVKGDNMKKEPEKGGKSILEQARERSDVMLILFELVLSVIFILVGYLIDNNYFRGVGVGLVIAWVTSAIAYFVTRKKKVKE